MTMKMLHKILLSYLWLMQVVFMTVLCNQYTVIMSDWVKLNVGGTIFGTTRSTLVSNPDTVLARMLESDLSPAAVSEDGAFLIDADPASFGVILNWLRRGKVRMNSGTNIGNVIIEADYFDFTDLKETL